MGFGITTTLRGLIANSYQIRVDGRGFLRRSSKLGIEVIAATAIPLLLLALAAIGGNMIQHRLVWSAEALKPKLSKISPAAGLKRLFSKQALVEFRQGTGQARAHRRHHDPLLWPRALPARRPGRDSIRPRSCR